MSARKYLPEVLVVVLLSIVIVGIDIRLSSHLGLLTYPPYYDGISYMMDAKRLFLRLGQLWDDPFGTMARQNLVLAPLWQGLMVTSFLVLGDGEWQVYTVRFWPTVLLLLLILWVVRRHGGNQVKWLAVACTGLLPTVSVGLRASLLSQYRALWNPSSVLVSGVSSNAGLEWYLADLRPDLLFAVLLLWSVVPLIEFAHSLGRRVWLISGTFASLALLSKSSMLPALAITWAIAIAYVGLVNRYQLRRSFLLGLWAVLPFLLMTGPWVMMGGLRITVNYILANAIGPESMFWSNPSPTVLSELGYYWRFFPIHMGNEAYLFLAGGLAVSLYLVSTMSVRAKHMFAYLAISAALWILVSLSAGKNYFIGLPYYLMLWTLSWMGLASFVDGKIRQIRRLFLVVILCIYVGFQIAGGAYMVGYLSSQPSLLGYANRQTTQDIAADLRSVLRNEDRFMWAPAYGFPATLEYYMMDKEGGYPNHISIDMTKPPTRFIEESVTKCKAILVYEEDIKVVAQFTWVHVSQQPYFQAIADWVKQPSSGYTAVKTYYLITDNGQLSLRLYLSSTETIYD